jgi:hypothetical protein
LAGVVGCILLLSAIFVAVAGVKSWSDRIGAFIAMSLALAGLFVLIWFWKDIREIDRKLALKRNPRRLIDLYRQLGNPVGMHSQHIARMLGPKQAYTKLPDNQSLFEWIRNNASENTRVALIFKDDICVDQQHISHQEPATRASTAPGFLFFWWRSE